jgi:hypothetical protein
LFDFLELPNLDVTWLEARKVMPPPDRYIRDYARLCQTQQQLQNGSTQPRSSRLLAEAAYFLYRLRWLVVSPAKMRQSLSRIAGRST